MRHLFDTAKSKVFLRYVLSYAFVFIVPLIVLGVVMYQNAVVNLQKEIEASNLNKLNQVKDMLDLQMRGMEQTAAKISYDTRLTPFLLKSNGYHELEAIQELGKYKANTLIADEVLLYYRGENLIYTSSGTYSPRVLTNDIYAFREDQAERFFQMLNASETEEVRPAEQVAFNKNEHHNMLTYSFPIPAKSAAPYGTVLFQVKEKTLTDLIENILGDLNGSVYIMDDRKNKMASREKGVALQPDEIGPILSQPRSSQIEKVSIRNKDYSLAAAASSQTGWSVVIVMPTDQFLGRVIEMKTFVALVVMALFIFGLGLVIAVSNVQYKPIRGLLKAVGPYRVSLRREKKNEWSWLRDTIESAITDRQKLLQQADAHRPFVRDQLATKLLRGDYRHADEVEQVLRSLFLDFTGNCFFVLLVSMRHCPPLSSQQRDELYGYLENSENSGLLRWGVELIHDKAFAIVVNGQAENGRFREMQQRHAANISAYLKEHFRLSAAIFAGGAYTELIHVNQSFVEASAAREYELKTEPGAIVFFEDIVHWQEDHTWYPADEQVRFVQGLKQGDRKVALDSLAAMMGSIAQKERSILLLKCMCSDLINTVLKTVSVMNAGDFSKQLHELVLFATLREFEEKLKELVTDICDAVERNRETKNKDLRDDVLRYIHDNFRFYEMSLENAADRFGLSVPFLSRFIKEQTGSTFTDYVASLRLEEIKRELKLTTNPIKDIIARNGYIGVSHFIEKFKKAEGMTPGEYRKLHGG
ncbi:AraC family transcriptional regulator [Paenibacillus contaminans]|nr:helix-turn-helix domain-containing protein [Paenibacillus contaminans]